MGPEFYSLTALVYSTAVESNDPAIRLWAALWCVAYATEENA